MGNHREGGCSAGGNLEADHSQVLSYVSWSEQNLLGMVTANRNVSRLQLGGSFGALMANLTLGEKRLIDDRRTKQTSH